MHCSNKMQVLLGYLEQSGAPDAGVRKSSTLDENIKKLRSWASKDINGKSQQEHQRLRSQLGPCASFMDIVRIIGNARGKQCTLHEA